MNRFQLIILCSIAAFSGYTLHDVPEVELVAEPVSTWQFDDCSCGNACECNITPKITIAPVSVQPPVVAPVESKTPEGYECSNGVCRPVSSQRRGIFGGLFRR